MVPRGADGFEPLKYCQELGLRIQNCWRIRHCCVGVPRRTSNLGRAPLLQLEQLEGSNLSNLISQTKSHFSLLFFLVSLSLSLFLSLSLSLSLSFFSSVFPMPT